MNDMTAVIQPKSDQLNADSLQAGPITIKIDRPPTIKPGTEQPITVHYENDDGKPWRPCKSMARVLVAGWGPDASKYVGKSLTLFRDGDVTWGGLKVGGIRVSHMSDLDGALTLALTATRGNKKAYKVMPLRTPAPATEKPVTTAPFDFALFEAIVSDELETATDASALTSWWNIQKPERMRAGAEDKDRAIKIAERVTAKINSLTE